MRMFPIMVLILAILLLSFSVVPVQAVEVIQRTQPQESQGIFSPVNNILGFLGANWMWFVLLGGIIFGAIFIMRMMSSIKEKQDVFLRYYKEVVRLCKLQSNKKRVRERAFWMFSLVASIFLSILLLVVALVTDDVSAFMLGVTIFGIGFTTSIVLKITKLFAYHDIIQIIGIFGAKIVGYYSGECITADGYKNYLVWNGRKWLFWKNEFVLRVNLNEKIRIETRNSDGKREIVEYDLPTDLLIEGENVIAIKGEGVDKANYFYYPLLVDKNGNIVNMDLIAFARAREVAMLDTLYQQTEDFARVQREAININPYLRWKVKSQGESVQSTGET